MYAWTNAIDEEVMVVEQLARKVTATPISSAVLC